MRIVSKRNFKVISICVIIFICILSFSAISNAETANVTVATTDGKTEKGVSKGDTFGVNFSITNLPSGLDEFALIISYDQAKVKVKESSFSYGTASVVQSLDEPGEILVAVKSSYDLKASGTIGIVTFESIENDASEIKIDAFKYEDPETGEEVSSNIISSLKLYNTETLLKSISINDSFNAGIIKDGVIRISPNMAGGPQLVIVGNPIDFTGDKTVTWTSQNQSVATIDQEGNLRAGSVAGETTITATCQGKQASVKIISKEWTSKEIDIWLPYGGEYTLVDTDKINKDLISCYPSSNFESNYIGTYFNNGIVHMGNYSYDAQYFNGDIFVTDIENYEYVRYYIYGYDREAKIGFDKEIYYIPIDTTQSISCHLPRLKNAIPDKNGAYRFETHVYEANDYFHYDPEKLVFLNHSYSNTNSIFTFIGRKVGESTLLKYTYSTSEAYDNWDFNFATKLDECKVVIYEPVKEIKLSTKSLTLNKGDKYTLNATISPSNATYKTVNYSSSDNSIVTVDKNGNLNAVGEGIAMITVKDERGDVKEEAVILVLGKQVQLTTLPVTSYIKFNSKTTVGNALTESNFPVLSEGYHAVVYNSSGKEKGLNELVVLGDKVVITDKDNNEVNTLKLSILGDVNGNGITTLYDSFTVVKDVVKGTELSEEQMVIRDYNDDGKITLTDAVNIVKIALKGN